LKAYSSNEEFFRDLKLFIEQLDMAGYNTAAQELRTGLSSLNGLTDGWALLLESMEHVARKYGVVMGAKRAEELRRMLGVVVKVVHR